MKLRITLIAAMALSMFFSAEAQVKKTTGAKKTIATKKTVAPKKKLTAVSKPINAQPVIAPISTSTTRIKVLTDSGIIILKLYDSTPLHRDNFVKLVNQGFYDSLMFHRVIPEFMIQGGDPSSKNAAPAVMLGSGGSDMAMIPAEFRQSLRHKRGALAAARNGNPEKASSACQFYIVHGKKISDAELDMLESRKNFKYSVADREFYKTFGGTPMLDMDYTVFGEIESGHDVVEKIAMAPRDPNNRPFADVRMRMEVIK